MPAGVACPGNKKPASRNGAGRCGGMKCDVFWRRRCPRPPSRLSGRRASLWCSLSGLLDSLSSAGHVCWAKPNHGFFRCQHFVAIIFNRFSVRAGCRRALERARLASATSSANSLHDACFSKLLFFSAFIQPCRHCTNQQPRVPPFLRCMCGRLIAPGIDEK